jgi:hypothetical protein
LKPYSGVSEWIFLPSVWYLYCQGVIRIRYFIVQSLLFRYDSSLGYHYMESSRSFGFSGLFGSIGHFHSRWGFVRFLYVCTQLASRLDSMSLNIVQRRIGRLPIIVNSLLDVLLDSETVFVAYLLRYFSIRGRS